LTDFSPQISNDSKSFILKRKQGVIRFKGGFENRVGKGTFTFEGDADYVEFLAKQGIEDAPDALLFSLFFANEDEDKVIENLQALQKLGLAYV